MDIVRILFVEDSDDVLVATYRLQRAGFNVDARTIGNPRELEESLAGWRPDVIVCDASLPDSRGALVVARLLAPDVPLVIVAGEQDYPNVARNQPEGTWAVVHKELGDELVETISRAVTSQARGKPR